MLCPPSNRRFVPQADIGDSVSAFQGVISDTGTHSGDGCE